MNYNERTIMLFTGLPGSGKTTLANLMHAKIGGARVNADQVRASISTDLKFTEDDRLVQAHRMGAISGLALRPYTMSHQVQQETIDRLNQHAIVDFVCPSDMMFTEFVYSARFFGVPPIHVIQVWMNTIQPEESRFADTAKLFKAPRHPHHTVTGFQTLEQLDHLADELISKHNLKKA